MTQITKELCRPIIGIENRTAQEAFDIMADRIRSFLSTLPIAGEGKALEDLRLAAASIREWMPETLPANEQGKVHFARALAESAAGAIEAFLSQSEHLSALISSPGKDGGQEVEAVAWSERENAFTDFWEQCPKLVDASDVGKARQAFMAGMDAASFFDSVAIKTTTGLVERLRKRADEDQACADNSKVIVDALSEQMRLFESRDGHNVYAVRMAVDHKSSMGRDSRYAADLREAAEILSRPQPASTALVERLQQLHAEQHRILGEMLLDKSEEGQAKANWQGGKVNGIAAALSASQSTSKEGER